MRLSNKEKSKNIFLNYYNIDLFNYELKMLAELFRKYIKPTKYLLDAGCGRRQVWLKNKLPFAFGVDIDFDDLNENSFYNNKVCSDMSKLPFADSVFDNIISVYTMEHIEKPSLVFNEFVRVVNCDGYLFLIVPNRYSIYGIAASLLPVFAQNYIWRMFKGKMQPHKVYYRANTLRKLKKLGSKCGLSICECKMLECPNLWLLEIPSLFRLSVYFQKFMNNIDCMKYFRSLIVLVMQKKS
ncbi:MAG: class I SAM-dependent methyltransferase [bacterium]